MSDEQAKIDANRSKMAQEIVDAYFTADTTVAQVRQCAKNWIETAAQHAANEEYYRGERDKLVKKFSAFVSAYDAAMTVQTDNLEVYARAWAATREARKALGDLWPTRE